VSPAIPDDIEASDLDRDVRGELRSLSRPVADRVARHLVAAGRLLDEDPEEALAHALSARRLASRISAVREAAGLAAYRVGEWQVAITELRTYHRMSGRRTHLAILADCERALGRPAKAIDIYRSVQPGELAAAEAVELLIVAAGARSDLGQPEAAVTMLQVPELTADAPWVARLRYAFADTLLAAGRESEAREWFARAADADDDGATDAAERLLDMDGVVLEFAERDEDRPEEDVSEEQDLAAPDLREEDSDLAEPLDALAGPDHEDDLPEPEDRPAEAYPEPAELIPAEPTTVDNSAAGDVAEAELPGAHSDSDSEGAPLVDAYDLVILDLDGVVYLGDDPIPGAAQAIERLRRDGPPVLFVTNNALRSVDQVAALLTSLGVKATTADVLTSATVAADVLAERLPAAAPVLVLGSEALADEVRRVGLTVVADADALPAAVVQGYSPYVGWPQLAEACLAVRAGAQWIVTNPDTTRPTVRGMVPGNGAMVAALRTALEREPDLVVGKPQPTLFRAAAAQTGARRPLVVGDLLDTDIEGAVHAGMDSLLVLTGVSSAEQARAAAPARRPTFVGTDLAALFEPPQPTG
jgi:glycerol-1-phosphatase